MAVRYELDFTSLRSETLRVEIHDSDYVGSVLEMDGDPDGFRMEWGGNPDFEPGPMPSSVSFGFLHDGGVIHDDLISDMAGAREGRFHPTRS